MNIDRIQLTALSWQNLFKSSLIGKIDTRKPDNSVREKKIGSLGLNKRNILFLVNEPESKYLPEDEMQVLANLLTACQLTMEDVAIVNYAQNPEISYEDLSHQFLCKKLLIFGVSTQQMKLPFNVPEFQIQPFGEQLYLFNPPFEKIVNDVALKSKLWGCLKKLFSS